MLTEFMMDSGAYLAWKRDTIIDVAAYCTFLHANQYVDVYINVDEINPRDPAESGLRSYQNFLTMRQRGLDPMPVYHVREDWDLLRRYLDLGCAYIGLAGSSSRGECEPHYEGCFSIIANSGCRVRVHAFGDSVRERLRRYPFDTADGATWILRSMRYTDMSRTAQANDDLAKFAERVYRQAHTYHRLELEVRDVRPDFVYYFGFNPIQRWQLAALKVVGHRHGLASWYGMSPRAGDILRRLIVAPDSVADFYANELRMLEEGRERCRR